MICSIYLVKDEHVRMTNLAADEMCDIKLDWLR